MKQNGNNLKEGNYYLGLDVGTNSVGWAVTDKDYNVKKFKGRSMWGARLFDEAQDASARRMARSARRRLNRRKRRLLLLEELFAEEINKKDPNFYVRMHDSRLWLEDKNDDSCKYALFNDPDYTDKDYLKKYPTVYHLRSDLIHEKSEHDIKLVFLALHHIMKSRGHFLYESSDNSTGKTLVEAIEDLTGYLEGNEIVFSPADGIGFMNALVVKDTVTAKKKKLHDMYGAVAFEEEVFADMNALLDLLAGATVQFAKLFADDTLKNAEIKSISLKDDLDSKYDQLVEILDDRMDLVVYAKTVFDIARLDQALGGERYLSDAKIKQFDRNKTDLKLLKKYVRENLPKEYKEIFNSKAGINNFAAYSRYKTDEKCTQEEMCKFLKDRVKGMKTSGNPDYERVYNDIENNSFYPMLKGTENGIIP
ncbi:MAG: type II CRISPR RNA-guided endonuclease Cas9, partial [Eubacterium sp.]|nr:type II CRISPR RNA-guided endonuclease Cas9 [Eubacterium sp.]